MIALAGAIGTGLFLGSGKSIQRAGPAGTLIVCSFLLLFSSLCVIYTGRCHETTLRMTTSDIDSRLPLSYRATPPSAASSSASCCAWPSYRRWPPCRAPTCATPASSSTRPCPLPSAGSPSTGPASASRASGSPSAPSCGTGLRISTRGS